ncbi:MAG: helix-turn-helix domain-containing protein [Victivallales bacterium]|nr:helix-turn-helix domain-containing protein [Victivallales bacterium]
MENKNTVPILEKALDLLEYIGSSETAVTLPELQQNLGISQASCYRIAMTLVQRQWLEKCSGNRYEIAAGINRVVGKLQFRLEKYKSLQPIMNQLANQVGFSAKFSVLDGDEFVNVCSAQCRTGLLSFSEPGFRSPLREIASVSTIFLSERSESEQQRILDKKSLPIFRRLREFYREKGYCIIQGQSGHRAKYPFDTLSFPVKSEQTLKGVISFLSLPGILKGESDRIASEVGRQLYRVVKLL